MPGSYIPEIPATKEAAPFVNGKEGLSGLLPPLPHSQLIERYGQPASFRREEITQLNEPFWAAYFISKQPETIYEPKEQKFYSYEGGNRAVCKYFRGHYPGSNRRSDT